MKYPWQWDITDLENLIGQPESLRLEFKDARLLDKETNNVNKVVTALSKEVSAFANTEGGTLIIGIEEDKSSKPRVALRISGADTNYCNPERLQQRRLYRILCKRSKIPITQETASCPGKSKH